ncbi:hypothetical protein H6P81_013398 [Aristolochia fimbriata]|uniref:Gag-pol polyprotein n=1 Tax=Aristolochia fimbriata TaxID=158543 RepID=A0AAV7EEK3_ARIFI|nr:hypothetical protein H6P81_013398 [Aristolochia fimbriata]
MATSMDIAQIVPVKLDGTNYVHWATIVRTFLKGRNLWRYVTGACPLPVLAADNSNLKAVDEWEVNNSKAMTLLVSSVSPSISFQIGKFDCARDAWVFLEKHYRGSNFDHKYKLIMDLHAIRQMPNQSISDFYAQMSLLWDQLAAMDPQFKYEEDTVIFQKYIEEAHLVQFFMALHDEYDSIRSSMLHTSPLPSVESALSELLAKVSRRLTRGPFIHFPKLKKSSHSTSTRRTTAASAVQDDSLPVPPSTSPSPIPTFGDIQEMINKALIGLAQGTSSASALSVSSGKSSWIIDSGASNHMTFDSTLFMSTSSSSLSPIYIADGSTLSVSYSGSICTSRGIHLSDVFHVPALSMNLLSVGQLCDLGLHVVLSSFGCQCINCKLGKHTALPFRTSETRSLAHFNVIHSDIWGPAPVATMGGSSSYVIFVDDYSRFVWVYLLHARSEFYNTYVNFSNMNGVAERKHRHIVEIALTLMLSSSVQKQFWGEAVLTSVYLINRLPSPVLQNSTPFTCLYGTSPDYSLLRVFGSTCFVLLPDRERDKLSGKSAMCIFLGYIIEQKGFRCFDPVANKLRISRHVSFWEHVPFYSLPKHSNQSSMSPTVVFDIFPDGSSPLPSTISDSVAGSPFDDTLSLSPPAVDVPVPSSASPSEPIPPLAPDVPPSAPHQSSCIRRPSLRLNDYHCFFSALTSVYEPSSYREASSDPLWQQAMAEELQALDKAHTWDLVSLPLGKSPIGCKWVYKVKTKAHGSIDWYKARLVAKGYNQDYGIDYEETFAPVARLTSVRVLIAIASICHWDLFQMDVKNAFLNGALTEEVYMVPPPGSSHPSGQVCRLRRALYGLKQAPRAWFSTFCSKIVDFGYTHNSHDSALFTRQSSSGTVLLLLYVDDMMITGDDIQGISDLKRYLSSCFEMKDLGQLRYFLGLEVLPFGDGYGLSQVKYASNLLNRAGLSDSNVCDSPMELNAKFCPADGELLSDPTLYRQLVGGLLYLTISRPDISYAVHVVSQFMSAPRSVHYAAVLHILRYIKGSLFQGLFFGSTSQLHLSAYSDADWAGDVTDRRSTTGYCIFLGDTLISWCSKKQSTVSRSSTEAEYRALANTTSELVWLRWLLSDMGV